MSKGTPSAAPSGLAGAFVSGLVFDRDIRRATRQLIPPLTRLALAVTKRMARQRVGRRRRLVPALALTTAVVAVAVAADPRHRRKLQRLIVH